MAYGELLDDIDRAELHRAIGLAAHGVGIGSFVYIRRIFERLIHKRFTDFKEAEGWKEEDFLDKRMVEKIELLKNHLPPSLVINKRIYSILSLGIHELTDEMCLKFFPVVLALARVILEEDKRKQEDLLLRKNLEKAIAAYEHPTGKKAGA